MALSALAAESDAQEGRGGVVCCSSDSCRWVEWPVEGLVEGCSLMVITKKDCFALYLQPKAIFVPNLALYLLRPLERLKEHLATLFEHIEHQLEAVGPLVIWIGHVVVAEVGGNIIGHTLQFLECLHTRCQS